MGIEKTRKRIVAVFLKFPEPGKVKTRLGKTMGDGAAAKIYRQLAGRVLEQVSRFASADLLVICYDPPEKESAVQQWLAPWTSAFPGEVMWLPQCPGDLGVRLLGATNAVFKRNQNASLAVIGTDCIQLDAETFSKAWAAMNSSDNEVAIAPSEDGGYVLIGMNRPQAVLFEDIPWSSDDTFSATVEAAEAAGIAVHSLPVRSDIDNEKDWLQFESQFTTRPCVFFDRDGVVNRSPGSAYVLRWGDFHLNSEITEALQIVHEKGYLAILVTSQKGVGKGLMSVAGLDQIHRNLQIALVKNGAAFDGIYAFTGAENCPHQAKPDPEMILSAAKDFCIDLSRSWMIGDADRDIEMGKAAGLARTVRIKGEKPIGIDADHTLDSVLKLPDLFRKCL